jgi:hypothetical protein
LAGSSVAGLGPVGVAVTVTPARWSASMKAVRANADGSSITTSPFTWLMPIRLVLHALVRDVS